MKFRLILCLLTALTLFYFGCKKKKVEERDCGCGSKNLLYTTTSVNGAFFNYPNNQKWSIAYQRAPNAGDNFFICNLNQDSVKAIIIASNSSSVVPVTFSGKVTKACPEETFGYTSGIVNFYYMNIDSIKRN